LFVVGWGGGWGGGGGVGLPQCMIGNNTVGEVVQGERYKEKRGYIFPCLTGTGWTGDPQAEVWAIWGVVMALTGRAM